VTPTDLGRPALGSGPELESNDAGRLAPLARGLFATIILAGLIAATSVWLGWRTKSDDQWVSHTFEVRTALADLLSSIQGAQAAERSYLLTGGDPYLVPYQAAVQQ
jgi:CHASE3 domain sensor protein